MKIYRLIQKYPNSPEIGFTINGMESEFYSIKPNLYPTLWECFESDKTLITEDGFILSIGDKSYLLFDSLRYDHVSLTEQLLVNTDNYKFFSKLENVIESINSNINIEIYNEKIIGEDISLFGVCISSGSSWQFGYTSSLKLFMRKGSENWKWFRTEKERDEFIHWEKPIFNRKYIFEQFKIEV